MPRKPTHQKMLEDFADKAHVEHIATKTDDEGHILELSFYGAHIPTLPPLIGLLTRLQVLDVRCNEITHLPPEIGLLTSLRVLDLSYNRLSSLPPEIGLLTNLQELIIGHNQLISIPPEIGLLTNLKNLIVGNTGISSIPKEIASLNSPIDTVEPYISYENQLTALPDELWQLTLLETLNLDNNQIDRLPAGIGQLINLRYLSLQGNPLSELAPEIGNLTKLKRFSLGYRIPGLVERRPPTKRELVDFQQQLREKNVLHYIPPEIWQLKNLQMLDLTFGQFTVLPPEIGKLANLKQLFLGYNQLTSLPPEIGQLVNLEGLYLHHNQLTSLPPEIGQLTNLESLSLSDNPLVSLPPEIKHLTNLEFLALSNSLHNTLPTEICELTSLHTLRLTGNRLTFLPATIGQLTELKTLDLSFNLLSQLPAEIGLLTRLESLALLKNRLTQLPMEMGNLANLENLHLKDNPGLLTPPPEIIARGTKDILAFLRELQKSSIVRYEAKLLVVGEGGTGKSSLLRALRDKTFESQSDTTHGIEIGQLTLASANAEITLNTWDFGGQHIYHATHQFFLTRRSIYLVVWNARLGVEQGRLHYWLETIKALAPDAPVLLIATHNDERVPDINYQLLKNTYPQLVGNLSVSNKTGQGLAELKDYLAQQAANLPLMGQPWPGNWLQVEHMLQARPEHHIGANTYIQCCASHEVEETIAKGTLGDYLHDLGKILYFRDDYILCNLVVLKANWITKAISLVLTDEAVSKRQGILYHSELARIWANDDEGHTYEPYLYPIFLRLMERFDLSYQIEADVPGDHPTSSLIPQLLPYQPPINLPPWPKVPAQGETQVEMVYRFAFLPAGIMSWFIVRTHRYTRNIHWREGVLLAYQGHHARVELNTMVRELRMVVWGVQPHNFFTILMNTVDIILERFQGLTVRREIPCICHWEQNTARPCIHFYRYEELVRRMEARRHRVECAHSFSDVSVPTLLYGIHMSTDEQVMADIQRGQRTLEKRLDDLQKLDVILEKLHQQSELLVRNFTRHWNLEMQRIEVECPNTFLLTLGKSKRFNPKNWVSQEYLLYLVCQHPSGPHQVGEGYPLREAEEWWKKLNPWLNHVIKFLKFGLPLGKALGVVYDEVDIEHMQTQIDLMEEIVQHIPETAQLDTFNDAVIQPHLNYERQFIGPALRALHSFLIKADSSCTWGGLYKTLTPDGNILWLCEKHRQQYEARPLTL